MYPRAERGPRSWFKVAIFVRHFDGSFSAVECDADHGWIVRCRSSEVVALDVDSVGQFRSAGRRLWATIGLDVQNRDALLVGRHVLEMRVQCEQRLTSGLRATARIPFFDWKFATLLVVPAPHCPSIPPITFSPTAASADCRRLTSSCGPR